MRIRNFTCTRGSEIETWSMEIEAWVYKTFLSYKHVRCLGGVSCHCRMIRANA